ncbi:MAG: Hsp20/alpha crystallin family protein [Verrucomicrobiota bacterium]
MSQTQIACQNRAESESGSAPVRRPNYRVSESDESFNLSVDLPGIERDALDISVEEDVLKIHGASNSVLPEGSRFLSRELPVGDYQLDLRLNVPINENKIEAGLEDGVLKLSLPKSEAVKPRKIEIS